MSDELKPCPFCGSTQLAHGDVGDELQDEHCYLVSCGNCLAQGPISEHSDEAAIAMWNERPITSEIDTKQLRELEANATPGPWKHLLGYRSWIVNNSDHPIQPTLKDQAFITAARNALIPLLDELDALRAEVADLREQLETIKVAAHMPEDYQYGLPSWINQRLYMAYIGAHISPILLEQIEKGQITFPNSPAERENADLRRQLAQHEGEMEI